MELTIPRTRRRRIFSRIGPSPLERAKASLTVFELWAMLGYTGRPSRSCRCPWRTDRKPSFSVRGDGHLWNDFSTGDGGDAVDFLGAALNLPPPEAARRFIEMAADPSVVSLRAIRHEESAPEPKAPPVFPAGIHEGTRADWVKLAILRKIPLEGIRAAVDAGHLAFSEYGGRSAWWILDRTRRNAHARRMDGSPWWGDVKSLALKNVEAGWPIGAADVGDKPDVALAEGEPDLLAAWAMIQAEGGNVAPVAMLGASNKIHPDALPHFAGKVVKIYAHRDDKAQGIAAALRWAGQLQAAGALSVSAVSFEGLNRLDGEPVSDLNDFLRSPGWDGYATADLCPECWERSRAIRLDSPFPCIHQRGGATNG